MGMEILRNKTLAGANFLKKCVVDVLYNSTLDYFVCDGKSFYVMSNFEAENYFRGQVSEQLGTFGATELSEILELSEDVFECIDNIKDNEEIKKVLECIIEGSIGMKNFIEIIRDKYGRGEFISNTDGKEYVVECEDNIYYIYMIKDTETE